MIITDKLTEGAVNVKLPNYLIITALPHLIYRDKYAPIKLSNYIMIYQMKTNNLATFFHRISLKESKS